MSLLVICFISLVCNWFAFTMLIRKRKYQKLWNREKTLRSKCKPTITKAELCEYYVMFCLRNDCKVDF